MPDLLSRLFRRRPDDAGLTCRELVELVTDYLEDALPAADRSRFEAHIAGCEHCATYLRQMRDTLHVLGELPDESISPQAEADLRLAFRDWKAGSAGQD
jgi:anti-sigma factor RsiW